MQTLFIQHAFDFKVKIFQWDDWWCVIHFLSLLTSLTICIFYFVEVRLNFVLRFVKEEWDFMMYRLYDPRSANLTRRITSAVSSLIKICKTFVLWHQISGRSDNGKILNIADVFALYSHRILTCRIMRMRSTAGCPQFLFFF